MVSDSMTWLSKKLNSVTAERLWVIIFFCILNSKKTFACNRGLESLKRRPGCEAVCKGSKIAGMGRQLKAYLCS